MTLTAIPGLPFVPVGAAGRGSSGSISLANLTIDAALESVQMIGRIFTADQASHTIDTTGSSSIQWRTAVSTFANAGTSVSVGIGAVDATNGPPARAANVTDTITFDVAAVFTGGGGGITSNAWQTSVPTTGTKTIANGDLVALSIQMTTRGGADSVVIQGVAVTAFGVPMTTTFLSSAYGVGGNAPNAIITFSDGVKGYFVGGLVGSVSLSTAWNNTSGQKEYGNLLEFPYPVRIQGAYLGISLTGDTEIVLYTDPLGTPAAQRSFSIDLNQVSAATASIYQSNFTSYYDLPANTPVGIVAKPTSATNVTMTGMTLNAAVDQAAYQGTGYAISRDAAAFAATNSSKDRYFIGLLIGGYNSSTLLYMPNMEGT